MRTVGKEMNCVRESLEQHKAKPRAASISIAVVPTLPVFDMPGVQMA